MSETPASASPIATQETVELRRAVAEQTAKRIIHHSTADDGDDPHGLVLVDELALRARIAEALSASEKRNEELVRERDAFDQAARRAALRVASEMERSEKAEALVTSLKAEVEEQDATINAVFRWIDDRFAALGMTAEPGTLLTLLKDLHGISESRLASLTGLVGDMRETLRMADQTITSVSENAYRTGLEGTSEWDAITGGNLYSTQDAIRASIDSSCRALELPAPAVSTTGEEIDDPKDWATFECWAEEGGVSLVAEATSGAVMLVIQDGDAIKAVATVPRYRWNRLVATMQPLPPVPGDPVEEGR
jgi:hypothetical protein